MAETMQYTGTLQVTSCWCGITLAVPSDLFDMAQNDATFSIHCPLGHKFVYAKGEADRQRERAERAEHAAKMARIGRDAAYDQARAAERSARAYRGHLTRLRNKIAAGICPVPDCRRHFDNVQAHIEGQHPTWAAEHPEVLT